MLVRIYNGVMGETECILEEHLGMVRSNVFSPCGTCVVSGSDDSSVTGDIEVISEAPSTT